MVKILHLYYDLMNLYGEYGNITILCDGLKKGNIDFEIKKYTINDSFDFDDFDFIYCGSGTEKKTELAMNDFIKRKESFNKALLNNKYILFTGSSLSLLGKNGIGIFNYSVINSPNRICGDVICESKQHKDIVGYINTSYFVKGNEESFIIISKSENELIQYNGLGFSKNNLLTINITGPLLIKNPHILKDFLVKLGVKSDLDVIDKYQYMSYAITLDQLKNRFN